ncbi:hypothetical protein [Xanthomonas vasicola]|uniref:hypothetical protein n=1 Tax=Xanthomonas vasicola TaxID=56459 RepID=UPI0021BD96DB|nr:hypothetical protein [Xanthomonas vasicola]MDO6985988.1 hypothetical protein [Xanthomonas vasicola]
MIASHPARSSAAMRWCWLGQFARFGKRSAACFVFGNGFSAGCIMHDHAGEQWCASIAER